MNRASSIFLSLFVLSTAACREHEHLDHGPYWEHTALTPVFTAKQDSLSTAFTGLVSPETTFTIGPEQGLSWTKDNARLTINADAVWAYQPIIVSLYDGEFEQVGSDETLLWRWEIDVPEPGEALLFVESINLGGRNLQWIEVQFPDYSGVTLLEVLGHD